MEVIKHIVREVPEVGSSDMRALREENAALRAQLRGGGRGSGSPYRKGSSRSPDRDRWSDATLQAAFDRFDTNRSGKIDVRPHVIRPLYISLCPGKIDVHPIAPHCTPLHPLLHPSALPSAPLCTPVQVRELHQMLGSLGLETDSATATAVLQRYDTDQSGLLELDEFAKLVRSLGAHPTGGGGGGDIGGGGGGGGSFSHGGGGGDGGGGGGRFSQDMVRDVIRSVASELVGTMPRQMARTAPAGARHPAQYRGGVSLDTAAHRLDASEERLYDDVMRARESSASRQRHNLNAALQQDRAHLGNALSSDARALSVDRAHHVLSSADRPSRTGGGAKVVDRRTGQVKGELLKGRFPWQRELEAFPSR